MKAPKAARRLKASAPILSALHRGELLCLTALWIDRLFASASFRGQEFDAKLSAAISKHIQKVRQPSYSPKSNSVDALQNHFLKLRAKVGDKGRDAVWHALSSAIACFWAEAEMGAEWNITPQTVSPFAAKLGIPMECFKRPTQIDLEVVRGAARQAVSHSSIVLGLSERDFLKQLQADCARLKPDARRGD